jgi:hypothetical protein
MFSPNKEQDGKRAEFWGLKNWVPIPVLLFLSCVAWGKSYHLSGLPFSLSNVRVGPVSLTHSIKIFGVGR